MSTKSYLENLNDLISSLRLAQRAELIKEDAGKNIIKDLYVDPLPNSAVLNQVIQDDTIFLIGRKGTGKSTIFAMAQEHFRHQDKQVSAYIDVKTLYGKSIAQDIATSTSVEVQKLLLFQNFVIEVLSELIKELEKNLQAKNILKKLIHASKFTKVSKELQRLREFIVEPNYIDISLKVETNNTNKENSSQNIKENSDVNLKTGINLKGPDLSASYSENHEISDSKSEEKIRAYSNVLIRHFSIKEYMEKISVQLRELGILKVHIFLDDFSEIDYDAQQIFVNTILAPLNNWSDKFFRFKVGAYPKRIFYGDIDKGKISEIQLDYYDLYKVKGLPELEEKAIDFLGRLLSRRFQHFLSVPPESIFQIDSSNDWNSYKRLLFQCSMNIPRVLGHILNYCYQSATLYNRKITKSLIEEASQKYYDIQVKYYFDKTSFLAEAFDERLDRYSQQLLVEKIVNRSKELKTKLSSDVSELFNDLPKGSIPTSHFYIKKEYERFFHSLELNYFISKYYEQADRDGIMISIYAINYGLCKANNIIFGRPEGHTKYRKYYISRHFDYDQLLEEYLLGQVEYECECGTKYNYQEFEVLEKIGMLCYKGCKQHNKIIERKLFNSALVFKEINQDNLLAEIELDILHVINQNPEEDQYATLIAQELDCSYQLVGHRASKLQEKALLMKLNKNIDGTNRKVYQVTGKAKEIYFQAN